MDKSEYKFISNFKTTNCCFGIIYTLSYLDYYHTINSDIDISYYVLKISLRNLSRMDFHASSTPEEKDEFALGLGAAYLLPIIEWIVTENIFDNDEQISMWFLLAIGIIAFFICLFANKSYGSPVYWLMGYHFHNVQFEGGKPYVLMSKTRSFRNKRQIKRVIRLFEDFLIDVS